MARNHNNRSFRSSIADRVIGSGNISSAVLEYRARQDEQAIIRQQHLDFHNSVSELAMKLLNEEWKSIRTKMLVLNKKRVQPITPEENEQKVAKEHENALKQRLAEAVIDNYLLSRRDKQRNLSKVRVAREVTASQVPVSLWAKHSDEDGNPLSDNPIDKGLNKGVYFLNKALAELCSEKD